jgi:hypothetical protein
MLFQRISQLGARHMPPLATTELDQTAINLLAEWINTDLDGAQIGSITLQPNGQVRIPFRGQPGRTYRVETSADLATWQSVGSVQTAPDGSGEYRDPTLISAGGSVRFYRFAWP